MDDLPPLPKSDQNGNFPAQEFTRISLARDIVRARQEAISRIETGKHTASVKLVDKIERELQRRFRKVASGRLLRIDGDATPSPRPSPRGEGVDFLTGGRHFTPVPSAANIRSNRARFSCVSFSQSISSFSRSG